MGHAGIFFNIIALIIGALAVFYSYQTHKTYKYPFLRPYMVFLIFFNISILFDLTGNYYYTNLAGDSNTSQYPLIIIIISIIGYFFYIAVTFTLIQVTQELQDKRMSSRVKLCFAVGTASVMVIYVIEVLFSPQNTLLNRLIIITIFLMTALLILIYLFLGCFLDAISMMVLTMPVIFPVIMTLGFDPIWFGVVSVLMMEAGLLTPPLGLNVFTVAGVAKEVPLESVFRGIMPFMLAIFAVVLFLSVFPEVATFLPNAMLR